MQLEPEAPRYRLDVTTDGLRAVISARRSWFVILFLTAWLGGWFFGEVRAAEELFRNDDKTPSGFLAFWLAGWTVGGVYAAGVLLWQLAGREIITLSATTLLHRIEVFGFGHGREYRVSAVRHLRSTDYAANLVSNQSAWFPPVTRGGAGPIAFDYGARTIRMGPALDEAEARMLVRELSTRLPANLQ